MNNEIQAQDTNFLSGIFLQKICDTSVANIDLQAINPYRDLTAESVDAVIDIEMKQIMSRYVAEEESFVHQKLVENPVVCERRASTRSGSRSDSNSSHRNPLQQQRAEACRRSRINNKIRKAKSKFRHKFITMKLAQNAAALECIREVIANAEAKLRKSGCSEDTLQKLRSTMGVDRIQIDNLSEIRKQLGNAAIN